MNNTIYRVTISHEDGDFSKDFDSLFDAEKHFVESIENLEKWTHTKFRVCETNSEAHVLRLNKDRKGRVIKITEIESQPKFKPGQTIDKDSCIKKDTLSAICDDVRTLSDIEHTGDHALFTSEIVFVDSIGNQYEYDGVCISGGKLKIAIKSNKSYDDDINKRETSKPSDREKRKLIQDLHSRVRNEDKAEYKGYIIINKPNRYCYWIGTEVDGEFVYHASVTTMAGVIGWIENQQ